MDVIELMNTIWADRHGVHDSLDGEQGPLRELRDALRALAAVRTHDPRPRAGVDVQSAIHTVNKHARARQLDLAADGTITSRPDPSPVTAIATQAVELFGQGDGFDLRACLAPGCVLYFIKDHPRREWCSAGCGNRARAARHYARHGRTTR